MMNMLLKLIPSRTWILTGVLFGSVSIIYLAFYDIKPAQEIRVEVNGLAITEGEIAHRMQELRAQDQQRGVANAADAALREAAIHDLVQIRLVDYEIQNRNIGREQVWDFLARVKPDFIGQVKARYLQILESRAIILHKRFDESVTPDPKAVSAASF